MVGVELGVGDPLLVKDRVADLALGPALALEYGQEDEVDIPRRARKGAGRGIATKEAATKGHKGNAGPEKDNVVRAQVSEGVLVREEMGEGS